METLICLAILYAVWPGAVKNLLGLVAYVVRFVMACGLVLFVLYLLLELAGA